jgi:hypothetical protein
MQTWSTRDKSKWGQGPWQNEPDKAQWVAHGLDCLIVRNNNGALCGYVGVPSHHKCFGKRYNEVDVCCHGGLTFSDYCAEVADEAHSICHTDKDAANAVVWWLGFDCAHGMDVVPNLSLGYRFPGAVYRTFAYVQQEVECLAKQLASGVVDG